MPCCRYICKVVQGRLSPSAAAAFFNPSQLILGDLFSLLVGPFRTHGSLQDLLNLHLKQDGQPPDELVAMHFGIHLVRMLGNLHAGKWEARAAVTNH
jgi:hypothetical protein